MSSLRKSVLKKSLRNSEKPSDKNERSALDKELKGKENNENRKLELSKFSHQSLVDIVVECELKYKRLCSIVEQMKSEVNELRNMHVNERAGLVETKKKLLENIFVVETEKFAIQDKNRELSDQVEQLTSQVETLKKQIDEYQAKSYKAIQDKSFSSKTTTPQCLSRANRRKVIYEKLFVAPIKTSKELIYENAILDLQEILDFYSLLTGISVWIDSSLNEEICEQDIPNKCFFNCRVQFINSPINGHEFGMVMDYTDNSFVFEPNKLESNQNFRDILPQVFLSESKYNIDDGFLFLKWYFTQLSNVK
ncbi:uncharacterized protein LOC101239766 isoform X1 [Hydra vulgaris]|uniref:uncharacterized protein LOC101239766 isoform X1 n=1 Tax=Hydra vulgaris TaxID=6087 RepID=UPI0006414A69|nr:uncharacterized protein LOC101239766 [Hydra vulgaris]